MSDLPLLPKATAVWLVDNTTLTFRQIAVFTGMHDLEISGIADGEVAIGIKGLDPVMKGQLTREEIARCEADPSADLKLIKKQLAPEAKRKAPRYTPLSKRQDRPAAIAWLVRYHPELADSQIMKLVGTTKPTIQSVRDKSHWNMPNIRPVDPVALGLCKQIELDAAVKRAAARKAKLEAEGGITDEEKKVLMSTEASLHADPDVPQRPQKDFAGLENFSIMGEDEDEDKPEENLVDAESLFNLPSGDGEEQPR
ncbi:MAG: cell cycle transcriptional regulator TrcR [Pseudomonadota bacterium]